MLIDSVSIVAQNTTRALDFRFRDSRNRLPYQVRSITGLDADEILTLYAGRSANNKEAFRYQSRGPRSIVMLLGLNPDWSSGQTFSDLRDAVYRFVGSSPTGLVEIRFNYGTSNDNSHVKAVFTGSISKVETNHFVDRPEIQLTIESEETPMLESLNYLTMTPVWEPISDPLGDRAVNLSDEISQAAHGFSTSFTFSGVSDGFKMEGKEGLLGLTFEIVGFTFQSGDVLNLSSIRSALSLSVDRAGETIHLIDKITAESIWPVVFPGDNYYTWTTNGILGPDGVADMNDVSWKSAFWGI